MQIEKALPLAMVVTLECTPEAMDVDHAGRCPMIRCFNCGKIGHTSKFCQEKRKIREVHTEEQEEKFSGRVPMKVSPLASPNQFAVLSTEETMDKGSS
jgi:uncharacterized Zn finger protein